MSSKVKQKNKTSSIPKKFERHFRIYYNSGHPAYIVDEEGTKYVFHRVTSSDKSGHHKNWKVYPNPDPRKKDAMYIVRNEEKRDKKRFSNKLPYNANLDFIKLKKDMKKNKKK